MLTVFIFICINNHKNQINHKLFSHIAELKTNILFQHLFIKIQIRYEDIFLNHKNVYVANCIVINHMFWIFCTLWEKTLKLNLTLQK